MRQGLGIFFLLALAALIAAIAWTRFGGGVVSGGGHPRLFDHRTYSAAKAAAATDKKLFLVKFTASWCPPCKEMDATTLVDPRVEQWVAQHAIAVAVDVDENGPLAEEFKVDGIPMIVAMRGDERVSQTIGYQSADEFLGWLKGLEAK